MLCFFNLSILSLHILQTAIFCPAVQQSHIIYVELLGTTSRMLSHAVLPSKLSRKSKLRNWLILVCLSVRDSTNWTKLANRLKSGS